ncbi:F0F1 ATP synthase subunit epsilon [Nitratireductor basaltis]|uniref:ATP synthase epsilon chain n=1 Tax=Nitratireductor basaltis TaxID=472175 RepID=A0A084U6T3_9HYPH|nr:F0F1 ATP synthase subunit epsilon [Nitratireductor basaltis]KFB08669.1 F-ATPase epsilon subunit [Nitratireductor basaltis]
MAQAFKFELVSPERLLFSEEATEVVIPGTEGEMTVMANHAPTMTSINPGVVSVTSQGGEKEQFAVFGGFADILPDQCTLLAEAAVRLADLSKEDLEQRIEAVRSEMEEAKDYEARSKAELYLSQLTTLQGAIIPA